MASAEILNLLKEIKQSNEEIKGDIKEIKNELQKQSKKITELEKQVDELSNNNRKLEKNLKVVNNKLRRKNIVVYGIPEDENPLPFFIKIVKEKLEVLIEEQHVADHYRLGPKYEERNRPVLIEFLGINKKQEIFRNVRKFKGSGISITNEQTGEERKIHRTLYKHLKCAREKNQQAKIVKNRLIVNGVGFTYDQLIEKEETNTVEEVFENTYQQINSEPSTPTSGPSISEKTREEYIVNHTLQNRIIRNKGGTDNPRHNKPYTLRNRSDSKSGK